MCSTFQLVYHLSIYLHMLIYVINVKNFDEKQQKGCFKDKLSIMFFSFTGHKLF